MLTVLQPVRYDAAVEKKLKILDTIRSLDLPNNPLDDIIDQVFRLFPLIMSNTIHAISRFCHFIGILFMYSIKWVGIEQI